MAKKKASANRRSFPRLWLVANPRRAWEKNGYRTSDGVPQFVIDAELQGCTDVNDVVQVARRVIGGGTGLGIETNIDKNSVIPWEEAVLFRDGDGL